jgi:hypothetical protein
MQNKFIKEEDEVDIYNTADYYYRKNSERKLDFKIKNKILTNILTSITKNEANSFLKNENDKITIESHQEKLFFKSRVADFYHEIEKQQKQVRSEKRNLELEEENQRKQDKEDQQLFDVDQGVNKLIKDSILETYDLVRNNKRASTIKMYVCSATNYLKKNKRI